jgi:hypothetical protein
MSRLTVGSLEGLSENSNVISVPTGHTLNVADAGALQIGGSGVVSAGLVHISRTTIGTSVSSVTVSSAFSADFDVYRVIVNLEAGSTDGQSWLMTFGSTSANYYSTKFGYRWSNSTVSAFVNNGAYMDIGAFSNGGGGSLSIDIYDPFATDQTKVNGTNSYARATASATGGALFCAGFLNDTTSYTAFTLTTNTGTMSGGTIDVYGYAGS